MLLEPLSAGRPLGGENIFLGIDVQSARGCPFVVLDHEGHWLESGWASSESESELVNQITCAALRHAKDKPDRVRIGIDSPRMCLPGPRQWYWVGRRRQWRARRSSEAGHGRHCEIILLAHGLATPQWTSEEANCPAWMQRGFAIFRGLKGFPSVYEVFPSASYQMLQHDSDLTITIPFRGFATGVKDMLDACVAAATVREFVEGRGQSVGGGDGLGEIILPRQIGPGTIAEVMTWPL